MGRASRIGLMMCIGVFLGMSCSSTKHNPARKDAEEMLSEGRVIVKIRKMPNSNTRLGQVTGVIDAPRERVWKVISDYNEQKHFMPNLLESFAIHPEALEVVKDARPEDLARLEDRLREYTCDPGAGRVVYTYGVGDFPWPMSNRRYILRIDRDPDHYVTRANMIIGQMKVNKTFWELKPYGTDGSKTLATYKILLDPGAPLPGFALNMAANSTLPEVIEAVRRKVKDAKYNSS